MKEGRVGRCRCRCEEQECEEKQEEEARERASLERPAMHDSVNWSTMPAWPVAIRLQGETSVARMSKACAGQAGPGLRSGRDPRAGARSPRLHAHARTCCAAADASSVAYVLVLGSNCRRTKTASLLSSFLGSLKDCVRKPVCLQRGAKQSEDVQCNAARCDAEKSRAEQCGVMR